MAGLARRRAGIVAALLVGALLAAATGGILTAHASKRHAHKVHMVYKQKSKLFDQSSGVDFVLQFCPNGTRVTGVGSSADGLAYVNEQEIDPGSNSGTVFYIDNTNTTTTIRSQLACIVKKTSKARGKVSRSARNAVRQADRAKRDRLQAALSK
jgi:hypothetical protein